MEGYGRSKQDKPGSRGWGVTLRLSKPVSGACPVDRLVRAPRDSQLSPQRLSRRSTGGGGKWRCARARVWCSVRQSKGGKNTQVPHARGKTFSGTC